MSDSSPPLWAALVPELTVTDVEASVAFYGALGFCVRFRRDAPAFAYLERGAAQVMLEARHAGGWETGPLARPFGRGVNLQIEVEDAADVAARAGEAGVALFRPVRTSWYEVGEGVWEGQVEVLVQDPDGYLLRFVQPLGAASGPPPA